MTGQSQTQGLAGLFEANDLQFAHHQPHSWVMTLAKDGLCQ